MSCRRSKKRKNESPFPINSVWKETSLLSDELIGSEGRVLDPAVQSVSARCSKETRRTGARQLRNPLLPPSLRFSTQSWRSIVASPRQYTKTAFHGHGWSIFFFQNTEFSVNGLQELFSDDIVLLMLFLKWVTCSTSLRTPWIFYPRRCPIVEARTRGATEPDWPKLDHYTLRPPVV